MRQGNTTLCHVISRKIRSEGLELFQTHRSNPCPLEQLLFFIHFLPFTYRKGILDACRIQESIIYNTNLIRIFDAIQPPFVEFLHRNTGYKVSPRHIAELFENIYDSPLSCSLLSYFCRAESSPHFEEARMIKEATLTKEISAALYSKSHEQSLDYIKLMGNKDDAATGYHMVSDIGRTRFLFITGIRRMKASWSRESLEIILPYFNGKKNVGYTTQELYHELPEASNLSERNITTLHLLRKYFRTGKQVLGPLEMRMKWGYGDIRPRVYYCLGGKDYWIGIFAQPIANELCKLLPSTNPFSRFNISRIGHVSEDKIVVTYDYTSFTTSLQELKFFLHALADEFLGVTIEVLDVRRGVEPLDVGRYLHEYNELVNIHQEFDLRRVATRDDESFIVRQGRSGSLGTQGNIVFSTVLHGLHLGDFTGTPDADSCVGDDALAKILATLLQSFISHVNILGEIHPEKFTILKPPPPDDPTLANRQQFKYLKRPITIDFTGTVLTGTLDAFPGLAEILFPEGDGIHAASPQSKNKASAVRTFCTQWGRFLTTHQNSVGLSYTPEAELSIILAAIRLVYDEVGLPHEGSLPGSTFWVKEEWEERKIQMVTDFFAPPCDNLFVFEQDWVMSLYSRLGGNYVHQPVRVGGEIPLDLLPVRGSRMRATQSGLVRLLEGLEVISTQMVMEDVRFDEKFAERLRGYSLGVVSTGNIMVDVTFNEDPPSWYFDVLLRTMPLLGVDDPQEKLDELSSIISF
jgi:hypothetical protein